VKNGEKGENERSEPGHLKSDGEGEMDNGKWKM